MSEGRGYLVTSFDAAAVQQALLNSESTGLWGTVTDSLGPGANFFLILAIIVVAVFVVAAFFEFLDYRKTNSFAHILPPRKVQPVIAYKTAELTPLGSKLFHGVSGRVAYDAVDEATGHGFHMYESIADALKHPQGSNSVFMEVVGYGDVVRWQYGYTTSHQKVTQVILGSCDRPGCREQGEYWSFVENGYFTLTPRWPNTAQIRPICAKHEVVSSVRRVSKLTGREKVKLTTDMYDRRDLEALLKERAGYAIPVVGEREGYDLPQYKRSTLQLDKIESIS